MVADRQFPRWSFQIGTNIPEGARVRVHHSASSSSSSNDGTIAECFASNGNDASEAYQSVGIMSPNDLPDGQAVIILDNGTAIRVPTKVLRF
jgi:hypothetical protein